MRKINFLNPSISKSDIKEASKVLRSGWLTSWNPIVDEFEKNFAKYLGAKKAVIVSSGTAALHVALLALDIGQDDEVITPALSWVASSNAILYTGARPVFVDINSETGLIDEDKVEKAITSKTKAILPVHLYGQMADMKKLRKIADTHNLFIVEDACHAIESKRDDVRPGQLGDMACFSFHAAKNITSGEGGAIVTNDKQLADTARIIADSGIEKKEGKRTMVRLGYKYSITAFQVALLKSQLKGIKSIYAKREKVFQNYNDLFQKVSLKEVELISIVSNNVHAHHLFVIKVSPKIRDVLRNRLANLGIGTDIHFNPIHLEPYYVNTYGYKLGIYPNAEVFGRSVISLPSYPGLKISEQAHIVASIDKCLKKIRQSS